MRKLAVFATEDERKYLEGLLKQANRTPVIALSSKHALEKGGLSGEAWDRLKKECHRVALEHGLPEIPGYYGMLIENGQFVQT